MDWKAQVVIGGAVVVAGYYIIKGLIPSWGNLVDALTPNFPDPNAANATVTDPGSHQARNDVNQLMGIDDGQSVGQWL